MLRAKKTSENILPQSITYLPLHSQNKQGTRPGQATGKQFFKQALAAGQQEGKRVATGSAGEAIDYPISRSGIKSSSCSLTMNKCTS
jgi:hypothetical protein